MVRVVSVFQKMLFLVSTINYLYSSLLLHIFTVSHGILFFFYFFLDTHTGGGVFPTEEAKAQSIALKEAAIEQLENDIKSVDLLIANDDEAIVKANKNVKNAKERLTLAKIKTEEKKMNLIAKTKTEHEIERVVSCVSKKYCF